MDAGRAVTQSLGSSGLAQKGNQLYRTSSTDQLIERNNREMDVILDPLTTQLYIRFRFLIHTITIHHPYLFKVFFKVLKDIKSKISKLVEIKGNKQIDSYPKRVTRNKMQHEKLTLGVEKKALIAKLQNIEKISLIELEDCSSIHNYMNELSHQVGVVFFLVQQEPVEKFSRNNKFCIRTQLRNLQKKIEKALQILSCLCCLENIVGIAIPSNEALREQILKKIIPSEKLKEAMKSYLDKVLSLKKAEKKLQLINLVNERKYHYALNLPNMQKNSNPLQKYQNNSLYKIFKKKPKMGNFTTPSRMPGLKCNQKAAAADVKLKKIATAKELKKSRENL